MVNDAKVENGGDAMAQEHEIDHGVANDEARTFAAVDIAEVVVCPADPSAFERAGRASSCAYRDCLRGPSVAE